MFLNRIISNEIPEVRISDTVDQVLRIMEEYKVEHLPVVKGNILLGTISETTLMNVEDEGLPITGLELLVTAIEEQQHLYEVIEFMAENKLSLVPVTNSKGEYVGLITAMDVIRDFAKSQGVRSEGSIIILEMNSRDYSLAEIARLAESNGLKILSAVLTTLDNSTKTELTLKLNKQDIEPFMATLRRYDYEVKAFYKAPDHSEDLRNRYEAFMKYLNT